MEDEQSEDLSEMFMNSSLDPRIENVMPILNKLSKNISENKDIKQVQELEEWANKIAEGEWSGDVGDVETEDHIDHSREPESHEQEENGMAASSLKSIAKKAERLYKLVKGMEGDTLEPWQQSKVTKADDYIDTVFDTVDADHDMYESDDNESEKIQHLMQKYGWSRQEALEHLHYGEHSDEDFKGMTEAAKRERIKHGSGEHMRKPGSKGAPTADALKKSATESIANETKKNSHGHTPKQQAAIAMAKKGVAESSHEEAVEKEVAHNERMNSDTPPLNHGLRTLGKWAKHRAYDDPEIAGSWYRIAKFGVTNNRFNNSIEKVMDFIGNINDLDPKELYDTYGLNDQDENALYNAYENVYEQWEQLANQQNVTEVLDTPERQAAYREKAQASLPALNQQYSDARKKAGRDWAPGGEEGLRKHGDPAQLRKADAIKNKILKRRDFQEDSHTPPGRDGDYLTAMEKAKKISTVIQKKEQNHPFDGKLVGEGSDLLAHIKKLSGL
jgi:hypothetical protein